MALTRDEVAHIAALARLDLTAEETDQYQRQLSAILDYAANLDELDLDGVPPTTQAVPRQNVMRPDVPTPCLPVEDVLFNAARRADNQFLIQSVLDE